VKGRLEPLSDLGPRVPRRERRRDEDDALVLVAGDRDPALLVMAGGGVGMTVVVSGVVRHGVSSLGRDFPRFGVPGD
jgi:hypothetical protein